MHSLAVTHGADSIGAAVRDKVRLAVLCFSVLCNLRQRPVSLVFGCKNDLRATEQIQI